ncbi:MAG: tandem-95 repeat protein, partial [Candidatus Aenigmarchaeota archaeon]|nr:tandem-95 repeat protein [Candidatus Aenigmarchaeota archaeon]
DGAMSDYQDITVTVANQNRAPTASDDTATTPEDTQKAITLSATDADGDNLTYAIVTHPTDGTVTISGTTATYTPTANYNGADSFTFKANDGTADSNTATITITVDAVNDAPTIDPEVTNITTPEDIEETLDLTQFENDVEDSDASLTWTIGGVNTSIFTASIDAVTDVLTITPVTDANGADTVTLTLTDSGNATATQNITVTVSTANDAPVAADGSATTDEDTAVAMTLNATDADDDSLTYAVVTDPSHGTVSISGATATYTPDDNYNGEDSFTFNANDGTVNSTAKTVTITVTAVNDIPAAQNLEKIVSEDTEKYIILFATDADVINNELTLFDAVESLMAVNSTINIEGKTLEVIAIGNDSVGFRVGSENEILNEDETKSIGTSGVSVWLEAIYYANDVSDRRVLVTTSSSANYTTAEPEALTYNIVSGPSHGTVILNGNITTYIPDANYTGEDSFTYNANDSIVNSTTATVSLTVAPLNDAPYIEPISDMIVFENDKIIISPNRTDIDGPRLFVYTYNTTFKWNFTSNAFEWTPDYLDSGNYTITISVSDGISNDSTTFNIEVKDKYHAFERDLALGWNLISFPYVLDSASIDDVLSTVDGNYNIVWAYNTSVDGNWPSYNPSMSVESSSLKTLENIQGFWINMTAADTLTVIGTIPASTTIHLNQGWNLISYPFDDSAEISCMLSQVAGNYTIVWQYNETAQGADYEKWTLNNPAAPSQVNSLDNFTKGYGYWINMTEVETLEWTNTC